MQLTECGSTRAYGFIRDLDAAVDLDCVNGRCERVKQVLEEAFASQVDFISPECLQPVPDSYARRLLHRDPNGRYSIVAMVWDKGQGTALHDHAGQWCVECVYRGRIEVTSYDLVGGSEEGIAQFERQATVFAGVGEAGALIPPFEYHTISNAQDEPSATIHVYGEELTWCHIFEPVEGGYRRVRKELSYSA